MESANDVLRGIALNVYHGKHGAFLRTFADAYILSDKEDREILKPVWKQLVDKYLLKKHEAVREEG